MEDRNGQVILSRDKAREEESWGVLETLFEKQETRYRRYLWQGQRWLTVDLSGATAFLPGSQVDIRPVRDLGPLMGTPQPFQILKIDRRRGNIVVSRRSCSRRIARKHAQNWYRTCKKVKSFKAWLKISQIRAHSLTSAVLTACCTTDIAWQRITHPSEAIQIGETVEVQVICFNSETQRISLGMKQLQSDPWANVEANFPSRREDHRPCN